ncbi:hypothetical protein [Bacillus sp. Bos-x628]|uniref:hypothetical protein n=1 Tax=Bacillus maqinnsis TaxID=3229854 RepID=UPI00338F8F81
MIKIQPHGFQSTVIRQGEPVEVENVTAHEDELLELVHEKLLDLCSMRFLESFSLTQKNW